MTKPDLGEREGRSPEERYRGARNNLLLLIVFTAINLLMPLLGGGRKKRKEYCWLCQSTKEYIRPEALRLLMAECALLDAETDRFMFGSCVSLCTYKEGKYR